MAKGKAPGVVLIPSLASHHPWRPDATGFAPFPSGPTPVDGVGLLPWEPVVSSAGLGPVLPVFLRFQGSNKGSKDRGRHAGPFGCERNDRVDRGRENFGD